MPPFSLRRHVDAEDPVQERGLAVVHVAEERDHRRPRLRAGPDRPRWSSLVRAASLPGQPAGGNRLRPPVPGPAARPCPGSTLGGDRGRRSPVPQLGQHRSGRHADRLGETPHGAGQIEDDLALRGAAVHGAGPPQSLGTPGDRPRGSLLFLGPGGGAGRCAARFRFSCRCSRPPRAAAPPPPPRRRAAIARGGRAFSRSVRSPRSFRGGAAGLRGAAAPPAGAAGVLGDSFRPPASSLPACGDAPKAACSPALAGPDRVLRELDVGLLRGGLRRLAGRSRLRSGGHRRQLDRRRRLLRLLGFGPVLAASSPSAGGFFAGGLSRGRRSNSGDLLCRGPRRGNVVLAAHRAELPGGEPRLRATPVRDRTWSHRRAGRRPAASRASGGP